MTLFLLSKGTTFWRESGRKEMREIIVHKDTAQRFTNTLSCELGENTYKKSPAFNRTLL
jgi:hypothetical protein